MGTFLRRAFKASTENSLHHSVIPPSDDLCHFQPFAIVRNPFSRVVSKWWGQLSATANNTGAKDIERNEFRRQAFKAYIQQLKPGGWGEEWNKFNLSTQASVLDRAQHYFDKPIRILKIETLSKDWADLAKDHGIVKMLTDNRKRVGVGSSDYGNWRQYYRKPWMIRKVVDCFGDDFKQYGYSHKIE